jgi:hypothetical protein
MNNKSNNTAPQGKLSERAMLASLTIHRWQATLTDQKVTSAVARQHDVTTRRAGKYRKNAIDVDAPTFRAVLAASSDIRHTHYSYTLPWGQDGARILTTANFDKYSAAMRQLRAAYERAVDTFALDYPRLVEAARTELNGLYNERDYPRNIRARFGIDLSIMPLPDAGDFRAALPDDVVTDIRAGIETELENTVATAMREPYERLYAHINRMVERLTDAPAAPTKKSKGKKSEPKAPTFRDTLVTGLADLCDILPGLNLTADPRLEELRQKSAALIAGIDAQTLRDKPKVREDVAKRAHEIQDLMAGFMGAPPAAADTDAVQS